jgi:hypothetical protein
LAIHWVWQETIFGKKRPLLRLFFRGRSQQWRELFLLLRALNATAKALPITTAL